MLFGKELIKELEKEIDRTCEIITERQERVFRGDTDWDDCFLSARCDSREVDLARRKIKLIEDGGCAWFREYATLDGERINARWCHTKYGLQLRAEMPDGSVVWTSAMTDKGLAKKGIKKIECLRPAWFAFKSAHSGLLGAYTGDYELFASDYNYATGEKAGREPLAMRDYEA